MKFQPSITFEESDTLISILGLGSNLDSRSCSKLEIIRKAINSLEELCTRPCIISSSMNRTRILSSRFLTFVNLVIVLFLPVNADPMRFLGVFRDWRRDWVLGQGINEPRPIDIDLLFFGKVNFVRLSDHTSS